MTDNRNTILAVILSGIVLIAWQYFYNVPAMERQRALQQAQSELAKPTPGSTITPMSPRTWGCRSMTRRRSTSRRRHSSCPGKTRTRRPG